MTGEGEDRDKNKLRREKARVSKNRKLTKRRKGFSGRLFMLEIDLNLDESLTKPRICSLELLNAKVKRQINSKNYLYLPSKSNCMNFLAHKGREISTVGSPSHC